MTFWIFLAAYLCGWIAATPAMLRRVMLKEVCANCGNPDRGERYCGSDYVAHGLRLKPRGAVRERNGGDVAKALLHSAWWPLALVVVVLALGVQTAGRGIKGLAVRATPLTEPELKRRETERTAEIERLMKEIQGDPKSPEGQAAARSDGYARVAWMYRHGEIGADQYYSLRQALDGLDG